MGAIYYFRYILSHVFHVEADRWHIVVRSPNNYLIIYCFNH
jgi:hypothetical protein